MNFQFVPTDALLDGAADAAGTEESWAGESDDESDDEQPANEAASSPATLTAMTVPIRLRINTPSTHHYPNYSSTSHAFPERYDSKVAPDLPDLGLNLT